LGLPAISIEKDFWVCWIIHELFALPNISEHLTFKGGTSLSKGWGLIQRFSEDIDIVIDRVFLGCDDKSAPETAGSNKERNRRLEKLKVTAQKFVQQTLAVVLERRLQERLSTTQDWRLVVDPGDTDKQTLLFEYTSAFAEANYVRPVVRIELGARSDTEPRGMPGIEPYVIQAMKEMFESCQFAVPTVLPKRTFWEKAMLLHEETYRAATSLPKPRLARHYYDLYRLIQAGIADEALADMDLFARVAAHRSVFFRKQKEAQDSLRPGSLRLMPRPEHLSVWKQDYHAMGDMFFGDVPDFDTVLVLVGEFEKRFDHGSAL
jgi:predicted nucleotidyltransferase component of viral defense system